MKKTVQVLLCMVWLVLCAALPAFGAESAPHVTAETTMAQLRANPAIQGTGYYTYCREMTPLMVARWKNKTMGEVGSDATIINQDKEDVAKAVTAAAVKEAGYDSLDAAAADKVAFVFMGHGTSHTAKVSYSQMQTTMQTLGYDNVFIGTVEGKPEETSCENVIEAVKAAGYTKVILRPLMVVAGDHANNDMAGSDDDSWLSMFNASDAFESVDCQIAGLGEIEDVQKL